MLKQPETPLQKTFWPDLIKKRRLELTVKHPETGEEVEMTQDVLAQLIGLKNGQIISLYENNARKPDLDNVPKLAEVLQLDPFQLTQWALFVHHKPLFRALFPDLTRPGKLGPRTKVRYTQEEEMLIENLRKLRPAQQKLIFTTTEHLASNNAEFLELRNLPLTLTTR